MPNDKEVKEVLKIGITKDGQIAVGGLLEEKELCLRVLVDTMKIILNHKPQQIQVIKGNIDAQKPTVQ